MRIIGGKYGGRRIRPPLNLPVRPTTDFAKEGLFNLLASRIELESVCALDLFCGTGSITLELLSRGCPSVTAVDLNERCCTFVRSAVAALGAKAGVVKANALRYLERSTDTFGLIFADPPFRTDAAKKIPGIVFSAGRLAGRGLLVVEHGSDTDLSAHPRFSEKRTYGNVNFSIFSL